MIDTATFFKEKKLPDWYVSHPFFKTKKPRTISKIFPSIGLPNFTQEVPETLALSACDNVVKNLCYDMCDAISYAQHMPNLNSVLKPEELIRVREIANKFYTCVNNHLALIVKNFKESKKLCLLSNISYDNKIIFKKGEGLFKVYNKVADLWKDTPKAFHPKPLEKLVNFKAFSAQNINAKSNVVFSSDGIEGAWDIATMSMRGISSCQSWEGHYKTSIIGSVMDPYTAIIYLESPTKTNFGTNMIRRCIVRFVVSKSTGKEAIFLERMYPQQHSATMSFFKEVIRAKIGNKFDIIDNAGNAVSKEYYVPFSSISNELAKFSKVSDLNCIGSQNNSTIFPYRDTFMPFNVKGLDEKAKALANAKLLLRQNILSLTRNATASNIIESLLLTKVDYSQCENVTEFKRLVSWNFFLNKKKISKELTKALKNTGTSSKDTMVILTKIFKKLWASAIKSPVVSRRKARKRKVAEF